jgi:hypothetical protein
VLENRFHQFKDNRHISFSEFLERLDKGRYTAIDLSKNNLTDDSGKLFFKYSDFIVSDLLELSKRPLKFIDLSFNRLGQGAWSLMHSLLELKSLEWINIVANNSLASIESTKEFEALPKEKLCKLIWIPRNWLPGRNWTACLGRNADLEKIVLQQHLKFYDDFSLRAVGIPCIPV